jgi:hypothetical protein
MLFRKLTKKEAAEFQQAVFDGTGPPLKWEDRALYHPVTRLAMAHLLLAEVLGKQPRAVDFTYALALLDLPTTEEDLAFALTQRMMGES